MFSGVKAPLVAIVLAVFSYALIQAYSSITNHFEYVASLEGDKKALDEENASQKEQITTLTSSLAQQQDHIGVLETTLKERDTALQSHIQKQNELEARLSKLSEESRNAIISITTEIKRAGLQNLRVPDNIVRMQRERAKHINTKSHNNNEGGNTSQKPADALPAVSDTRG
ncbi:hypothetical protein [Atlantibacter hermannii]|uniref:hypothetical protein n=1 Tax=Atlantibacter hermannii TaxID=565 RepID=UPI0028A1FDCE|nr:hypothetical protein [Atlantibacter hermannii]